MNDEELRAFLDSATIGETENNPEHEAEEPDVEAGLMPPTLARPTAPTAPAAHLSDDFDPFAAAPLPETATAGTVPTASESRKPVPSFDELMHLPAPTVEPESGRTAPALGSDGDEELVPLILPGFSPEPRQRPPLPPVFRAETFRGEAEPAPTGHAAPLPLADPAPTQPFDVAVPASLAAASRIPAAASSAGQAANRSFAPSEPEDSFSALSPDLIAREDIDAQTEEYEKISVTGGDGRGRKALPWIIVGGGVVVAIIAALFVVNGVLGANDSAEPAPTTTQQPADPSEPEPTEKPEPTAEPEPETPEAPTTAPVVDPGDVFAIPITQWGLTVDKSQKLGSVSYTEQGDTVIFDIPLAADLSDACAAAREGWGLRKKEDGKLEAIRPEPRCTAAGDAAVYDTIWGLMDHMAKSAREG